MWYKQQSCKIKNNTWMSITLTVGGRINKVTRNMVDVEVNLQSIVSVTYLLFHNGHSPALKAACERCLKKPPLVVKSHMTPWFSDLSVEWGHLIYLCQKGSRPDDVWLSV